MSAAQCVVWDDQQALTAGVARRIVDLVSDIQRNGGVGGTQGADGFARLVLTGGCLLYTSPSPRDRTRSRMPSSA